MKHSYEMLKNATTDLKSIIEHKFDDAYKTNDRASMQRYLKIFPMINHRSSGLQVRLREDFFRLGGFRTGSQPNQHKTKFS